MRGLQRGLDQQLAVGAGNLREFGPLSKKASRGLLPCLLDQVEVATYLIPATQCLLCPKAEDGSRRKIGSSHSRANGSG